MTPTPRQIAAAQKRARDAANKAAQRERIRAWILKQTGGKITTAEGYVMEQMRKELSNG